MYSCLVLAPRCGAKNVGIDILVIADKSRSIGWENFDVRLEFRVTELVLGEKSKMWWGSKVYFF